MFIVAFIAEKPANPSTMLLRIFSILTICLIITFELCDWRLDIKDRNYRTRIKMSLCVFCDRNIEAATISISLIIIHKCNVEQE